MIIEKVLEVDNDTCNSSGGSLQGTVTADYYDLVEAFGEPCYRAEEDGGFDKVWTAWRLSFKVKTDDCEEDDWDYVDATIYDWKEDSPYTSRSGTYTWNVGGRDYEASEAIDMFLEQKGLTKPVPEAIL